MKEDWGNEAIPPDPQLDFRQRADTLWRLPWLPPAMAFRHFASSPGLVFFDSQGEPGARSRYSYLCLHPVHTLRVHHGITTLDGHATAEHPFAVLAETLRRHRVCHQPGRLPFQGGAAGFIGYDVGATLDRAPRAPGSLPGIPDMLFGIFETVLGFDHAAHELFLAAPDRASRDEILARLAGPPPVLAAEAGLPWRAVTGRAAHLDRVRQTIGLIGAGDIYQANIAATFGAARRPSHSAPGLFLALRAANPAPFGAYIDCGGGCAVLSVSPERFLRVTPQGLIETRPIKGTRKRGADAASDAVLRADLLASAKDRAENLMIVDLLRNDLARVADRVTVPALYELESFAHVHHLVSTVHGRLRPGLGPVDLLRAAFPGGSVTGAPKLRAMEVIASLERHARGPYCGAAAWIGFDGAMDSNILIRTLTVAADRVVAQAGGGIVADSDPEAEWEEVLAKIMPLLRATGTL